MFINAKVINGAILFSKFLKKFINGCDFIVVEQMNSVSVYDTSSLAGKKKSLPCFVSLT